jgi:diguanylate cyclase (GGDEF)-like protein
LRKEDTIARFGGDEFLILLESYESREGVEEVVKKIMSAVSVPIETEGHEIRVHASIGVAIGPPGGSSGSALIAAADAAMYRAKAYGPGNYQFWSGDTSQERNSVSIDRY